MRTVMVFVLGIMLSLVTVCGATTYVVQPDGFGNFATIQAAVTAVLAGDIIELADGTFTGDGNRDIDFGGKDVTVRSQSGDHTTCVIDCGGSETDPHRGFTFQTAETTASLIENLAIINGHMCDTSPPHFGGGGLRIIGSSPTVRGCRIESCTFTGGTPVGMGISIVNDASPIIEDCLILSCSGANSYGGGIGIYSASPTIRDCSITGNTGGSVGGGIYIQDAHGATIERCSFISNSAIKGGGIRLASITLTDCLIVLNTATAGGHGGGVLMSSGGLLNCTVAYNQGAGCGSGIFVKYGTPSITNCLVAFNEDGPGIGAYREEDFPTMTCCDVYGHTDGNYDGVNLPDQTGVGGNISADPLFCEEPDDVYAVDAASPCLAANNGCGVLMGVNGQGCGSPVESTTWGVIKAMYR